MKKTKLEEEKYLNYTLKEIDDVIDDIQCRLSSVSSIYKNDPVLYQNFTNQYKNRLRLINKTADKPYFARIDFRDFKEDKVEECYIGKVGVFDEIIKLLLLIGEPQLRQCIMIVTLVMRYMKLQREQ